jgi:hypothetical protein
MREKIRKSDTLVDYVILSAGHKETLAGLVNGLIAQGWQPIGGVAIFPGFHSDVRGSGANAVLFQAMVKS